MIWENDQAQYIWIWEEAIVTYLKVFSHNFPRRIQESHDYSARVDIVRAEI